MSAVSEPVRAARAIDRVAAGLQALRYPGFLLAVTAGLLVATGAAALAAAIADLVYRQTGGDTLAQGVFSWLGATPFVIVPLIGGVLADRFDRRTVWLGVVAAVCALALVLGLAERGEGAPLVVVFVAVFGLSIAAATGTPVQQAFVANLVPAAVLGSAVGLLWA